MGNNCNEKYYYFSFVGMSDKPRKEDIVGYNELSDDEKSTIENYFDKKDIKEILKDKMSFIKKNGEIIPNIGPILGTILEKNETEEIYHLYKLKNTQKAFIFYFSNGDNNDSEIKKTLEEEINGFKNIEDFDKDKIEFVPVEDVDDPTDIEAICLGFKKSFAKIKGKIEKKNIVYINGNSGTPAMHQSLLILFNRGLLGNVFKETKLVVRKDFLYRSKDKPVYRIIDLNNIQRIDNIRYDEEMIEISDLKSSQYKEISDKIEKAAKLNIPIFLVGKRGTGKTTAAYHYHKKRMEKSSEADDNKKEFVNITLSEYSSVADIKSELFGWAKGSFTGADSDFEGLLGKANGGTLFLDEIHQLPRDLQSALLRPLNDGKYRQNGTSVDKESKFGLVIATNDFNYKDKLNEDFRDRVERVVIELPELKDLDEKEDIFIYWKTIFTNNVNRSRLGTNYNFDEYFDENSQKIIRNFFKRYSFPGNIRDLLKLSDHIILECVNEDYTGLDKDMIDENLEKTLDSFIFGSL